MPLKTTQLITLFVSLASITFDQAKSLAENNDVGLVAIVKLLADIDDGSFQLDLLKGMKDGLRGRKDLKMPAGWPDVYQRLAKSDNDEVREISLLLALVFNDPAALKSFRATMLDAGKTIEKRKSSLAALVEKRVPGLAADLQRLLDDKKMRRDALRGLGAYSDGKTPNAILQRYLSFSDDEQEDAIVTLSVRADYASQLLDAIEKKIVSHRDISAFIARQMDGLGDKTVSRRLRELWGELRPSTVDKQELIAKYKREYAPSPRKHADASLGRLVFNRTCAKCHKLFGEGNHIGPDLTGSNRANLDYVLQNVLDPSAAIGKDYQLNNIRTVDGRVISGIIVEQSGASLTLQAINDRVVVSREDIDEIVVSPVSMMPNGQFESLTSEEIHNLLAYLAAPAQVPLPPGSK